MSAIKATIIGASGYTAIELIRLLSQHPQLTISQLVANRKAGLEAAEIFGSLAALNLPPVKNLAEADFSESQVIFSCLPHLTLYQLIDKLPKTVPIIDLSADFRL